MIVIVAYCKQAANNGYIHDDLFDLCGGDGHVRRKDGGMLVEGCRGLSCQERRNAEGIQ